MPVPVPPAYSHLTLLYILYISKRITINNNNNFVVDLQQLIKYNTYTNYHIQILWILMSFSMVNTSIWMQLCYYYYDLLMLVNLIHLLPYFVACTDYHYYVNSLIVDISKVKWLQVVENKRSLAEKKKWVWNSHSSPSLVSKR